MKYPIAIAALTACWLTATSALAQTDYSQPAQMEIDRQQMENNGQRMQIDEQRRQLSAAESDARIAAQQGRPTLPVNQYNPEAAVVAGIKPVLPLPPRRNGWANANEAERAKERYDQELERYNNALERWTQLREAEAPARQEEEHELQRAPDEPLEVQAAVDYQKLLPVLPEPPQGWTADKAEGSTEDVGGFGVTNVRRDYHKGEGDKASTAAISILDSVSSPDYVSATTAAWNSNSETAEGYGKSVTIDGSPGFEAFEKETKHATLYVMIANRYFVGVELQNQNPAELQEWVKRVDLKRLVEIK